MLNIYRILRTLTPTCAWEVQFMACFGWFSGNGEVSRKSSCKHQKKVALMSFYYNRSTGPKEDLMCTKCN